jgi:putative colanic acid biosynthesis UDP-glucose lipid carrier transferase
MNKQFTRFLQFSLAGLDIFSLNFVIILSQLWLKDYIPMEDYMHYAWFWFFLNISWIVVALAGNIYTEKYIVSFELFSRRTFRCFVVWLGLILLYLYIFQQNQISKFFTVMILFCIGMGFLLNRFAYLVIRHYFREKEYLVRKVLILGYNESAKKMATYLEEESIKNEIVGFCEEPENVHELSNYPILSRVKDAMAVSREYNVSEIYSTITPEQDRAIYHFMQEADRACIRFRIVPDMSYFINRPVHVDYVRDIPVLSVRKQPLDELDNRIKKRLFDIVVSSLVILFVLSWLIPLVALLIWLESKGPIFFVQQRAGKNNKPFNLLKFRTMIPESSDVDASGKYNQATRNDPRITKIGAFLRKSSIDELPQFFNAFMGTMSVVGPRPHPQPLNQVSVDKVDDYMLRHFVKPGITGWAQVNGYRGETNTWSKMKKRVEHDIWYNENWSSWLDLRIVLKTVFITLQGDKNAF